MTDYPDLSGNVEQPNFAVETSAGLFERITAETDDEATHVWSVEYRLNGVTIRRSVHVYDKKGVFATAEAAALGG